MIGLILLVESVLLRETSEVVVVDCELSLDTGVAGTEPEPDSEYALWSNARLTTER